MIFAQGWAINTEISLNIFGEKLNRNISIDVSRALAVMLVTLFHVSRGPSLPTYPVGDFDIFGFLANGWVGVGIFFIISGYCMGMSTERDFKDGLGIPNYIKYSLKRVMRIAPPYYISIAVWVLIINVYKIAPKPTEIRDIVTHLTFTHNLFPDTFFGISGVFWSIGVEMQFYLILPFIIALCRGLFSSFLILLICLGVSVATYGSDLSIVYKWGLMNYLVLFVYGWILYTYREFIQRVINLTKIIYIAVPAFILLISYRVDGGNNQKMYEMLIAFTYGIIMLKIGGVVTGDSKSKLLSVILLIGQSSFSIYLYNYIYNFAMPRVHSLFSITFMFAGVIGFGIIMYLLVEVNTEKVRSAIFKKNKRLSTNKMHGSDSQSILCK